MDKRWRIVLGVAIALAVVIFFVSRSSAKPTHCTGADPCEVCRNCKRCQHCHVAGQWCGVCKEYRKPKAAEGGG